MKMSVIAATCLLLLATAVAQEKSPAAKSAPATPALETQVHKFWDVFKTKDKKTLATLLSASFHEVEEGDSGFGDMKAELASMDDFVLISYTLKDFKVKSLGPHAALVTYLAHYEGKSGGQPSKSDSAFGEVWIHEGNDWKALYTQETAVK
jgi:hypothetical protein